MNQNQPTKKRPPQAAAKQTLDADTLTDHEKSQLADEATQEVFRKAYLAQLRQRQCPDCGEGEIF